MFPLSRWITDQKQTLEKEIAELEDEREGLFRETQRQRKRQRK